MMKRICKFRYKLILLLLILSILLGEFAVRPMSVKAIDLTLYSYWDLWYSISGAQHVSMSAKNGPFTGDDVSNLKSQWSTAWVNYNIWLDTKFPALKDSTLTVPRDVYLEAKAAGNDRARVQFQDFLFYLKDTASDLVPQAYDLIQNAKTTGLEMSQELWDAFRQYFDDVSSDKIIYKQYQSHAKADFVSFMSNITHIPTDILETAINARSNLLDSRICVVSGANGAYYVFAPCNAELGTWRFENGRLLYTNNFSESYYMLLFYFDAGNYRYYYGGGSYVSLSDDPTLSIISTNWKYDFSTVEDKYSPFIDYTVSQGCPVEVPETIPWRVYPKEETDDDTKIIPFPVEVPDEGTTEVPGEETTEKPNPDEDPNNDNDEENDPFPGIFPWFPSAPEIPEYKPWVPDDDDDPDPDPDPEPDPPPPPSEEDDPDPEPDPEPDPPPPPGKVEGYLNKLKTKFPFCIPFDMVTLFKNLKKTQKAPKWTFSYTFRLSKNNSYTWKIVVDMADYDQYIQIFREGFFVLFLVGLLFVTRKLISWQID